jgi:DNA-binding response OmpR family regulator
MNAVETERRSLHILVVEDELLIRWSIAETLSNYGHTVTQADSGAAAIRELSEGGEAVDAIVLDYRLPDSNDFTLLRKIRELAPRAPVIVMTAYGNPEIAHGAIDLGAHAVMNKPFDLHDLEARLRAACAAKS